MIQYIMLAHQIYQLICVRAEIFFQFNNLHLSSQQDQISSKDQQAENFMPKLDRATDTYLILRLDKLTR